MNATVYLDHAASTPLLPEALEVMQRVASLHYANPSGSHRAGRTARASLEDSRERIAAALGASPHEIVFTSGGTESDNLAVLGGPTGRRVVSAVEHKAVLAAAPEATLVPVDGAGVIDLDALGAALGDDVGLGEVGLVSVMAANNEVGSIQPLGAVLELTRRRSRRAAVHSDAVQALGWVDLPPVDLLTITGHKLGGPRGIGVLVVRKGTVVRPLLHGGGQEEGRRPGTEDVAAAAGLAVAVEWAVRERPGHAGRIAALADRLAARLGPAARRNGPADPGRRLPHICHVTIESCRAEDLLVLLDRSGIAASAGSACASGAIEPSPVLAAMGMTDEEARSSIRFSLGWQTTESEVDRAAAAVLDAIATLVPLGGVGGHRRPKADRGPRLESISAGLPPEAGVVQQGPRAGRPHG